MDRRWRRKIKDCIFDSEGFFNAGKSFHIPFLGKLACLVKIRIENARNRKTTFLISRQMRIANNTARAKNNDRFWLRRLRPPLAQSFGIKNISHNGKPPPSLPTTRPLYEFLTVSGMAYRPTTILGFWDY